MARSCIATPLAGALLAIAVCSYGVAQDRFDACPEPCGAFQPRWFAAASAVYMDRKTEDASPLMQNVNSPLLQLNARDFDFDWGAGFEVSLAKRFWDESAVEFRYFDLGQLDAAASVITNAASLRVNAAPPVFASNVQTIDSSFTTTLRSVEANLVHAIHDEFKILCGLRYVGADDDLIAVLDAGAQRFPLTTRTRNDLYGIQVGAVATPCKPVFLDSFISGVAKIGAYGNDVRHRSTIDTGVTGLVAEDSPDRVSFVGELRLGLRRPLTRYVDVYGGYGLIWMERVAVATDQIRRTDFFNGTGSSNRGNMIFHGAHFGIEVWL